MLNKQSSDPDVAGVGGAFFHNGSSTKIRDVVRYFNAGIPQDAAAGAARTLSRRFTHPAERARPKALA